MAKDKLTEYDATANNNTVVGDVNLAENSALPSDMNNAVREIMSHQKEAFGAGTPLYVDQTNNRVGVNKTPTVALDVNGALSVSGDITASSLNGGQFGGRRNLIINGAMQINQRGASSVTSGYFVDRFTLSACSASAVLTSSTPTEFPKAISVSATSGNPIIIQKIESKSCQGLSGKTVTASFYAKNISNATTLYASLQYAGSADNFGSTTTISEQNLGSLSGSWVRYTASWTVPSGGLNGLALNILCAGSSTFTMGVTGVQLEVGSVATPFEHSPYGEELELCKRYFNQIGGQTPYQNIIQTMWISGNTAVSPYYHRPALRATPAITKLQNWSHLGPGTIGQTVSADQNGLNSVQFGFSGGSGGTSGTSLVLRGNNNSGVYITFDAEL